MAGVVVEHPDGVVHPACDQGTGQVTRVVEEVPGDVAHPVDHHDSGLMAMVNVEETVGTQLHP